MFRPLLEKEWRQLRLLRWAGIGIGLLLPILLLVAAEAGKQGWTILGSMSVYSAASVIQDGVPMFLAVVIWPLMALLVTSQAFCADRAAGTEAFLLQSPVRRSLVWRARALAAVATVLVICAGQFAIWWLLARMVGGPNSLIATEALVGFLSLGGLLVLVAMFAGSVAGGLARSPIQALLLSLVLGSLPLGFGVLLGGVFPWVGYGSFRLGHALPVVILVAYAVAAFSMACKGEPAGRGRVKRGLGWVAAGVVAVPLAFAAIAPGLMRLDAKAGLWNIHVVSSSQGEVAFFLNSTKGAGWLVDLESGHALRFFPPPVYGAVWNEDGSRLAVLHEGGSFGRLLPAGRLEILDARGEASGPSFTVSNVSWHSGNLAWSGSRVLVPTVVPGSGINILDTSNGSRDRVDLKVLPDEWQILSPTQQGDFFVLKRRRPGNLHGIRMGSRLGDPGALLRLDVSREKPGPEIPVEVSTYAGDDLSPSGRFWFSWRVDHLNQGEEKQQARWQVQDLVDGSIVGVEPGPGIWVGDDVLVTQRRGKIMAGPPGAQELLLDSPKLSYRFRQSPDGNRMLIDGTPRVVGAVRALWIYDAPSKHLESVPLPRLPRDAVEFGALVDWGSSDTLIWIGNAFVAVQDLESDGELRPIFGRMR